MAILQSETLGKRTGKNTLVQNNGVGWYHSKVSPRLLQRNRKRHNQLENEVTTLIELIPPYDIALDIDLFLYGHLVGKWRHRKEYIAICIADSPEAIDFLLIPGRWTIEEWGYHWNYQLNTTTTIRCSCLMKPPKNGPKSVVGNLKNEEDSSLYREVRYVWIGRQRAANG